MRLRSDSCRRFIACRHFIACLPRPLTLGALSLLLAAPAVQATCAPTPAGRFVVQDALVHDTLTQLTWQRCSVGVTWSATAGCADEPPALLDLEAAQAAATEAGAGWRLPTLEELHSLARPGCTPVAIDEAVFPHLEDLNDGIPYWSSTPAAIPAPTPLRMNYYVDFLDGHIDAHSLGFPLAVRLVRELKP